jgi:AcrR family transcriptional regulator
VSLVSCGVGPGDPLQYRERRRDDSQGGRNTDKHYEVVLNFGWSERVTQLLVLASPPPSWDLGSQRSPRRPLAIHSSDIAGDVAGEEVLNRHGDVYGPEADRAAGLPQSLALVWGLRERPRRGPKPGLSLERIVDAAVELADAEGLAAVSMSRLAEKLGFTTMSIYRYVSGKDELLMLMVDAAAVAPTPDPRGETGLQPDWRTAMEQFSREQLKLLRRHPWVTEIPLAGPPITPSQVGWMEYGLRSMADTGLDEGEKIAVLGLIALYVRNEAKLEYDMGRARRSAEAAAEQSGESQERTLQAGPGAHGQVGPASYGQLLRRLIDPQRFPALMKVVDAASLRWSLVISTRTSSSACNGSSTASPPSSEPAPHEPVMESGLRAQ